MVYGVRHASAPPKIAAELIPLRTNAAAVRRD
jgi:hypothetical protein